MLHPSSLHYYACYYALLCLLHQQQQAATVTIIIDGATTNEWATRDEYQRLIDSSQGPSGPTTTNTNNANTAPLSIGPPELANAASSILGQLNHGPPPQPQQASLEQLASSASAISTLPARSPTAQKQQQQQHFSNSQQETDDDDDRQGAAINLDELQLALDRLDLIEHERKEQVQQLNRLQVLEKMAESNVVSALTHGKANTLINKNNYNNINNNSNDYDGGNSLGASEASSRSQYPNEQQQQQQLGPQPPENGQLVVVAGGARTISDLVPFTDVDLEDPLRRLKERETPRKYCGPQLMDVLDLVCQGRYYVNEYEPKIVNPTIKNKRSIDYGANSETLANEQLMQMMPDSASAADVSVGTLGSETGRDGGGVGVDGNGISTGSGPARSRRTKLRALARGATLGRGGHGDSDGEGGGDNPASFVNGDKNLRANYDNGNNLDDIHNQNRHQSHYNQQQQQHYLSSIDIQKHNHNQNQDHNHNHNQYNDGGPIIRNRHSKMAQYRRIRGASKDCCDRSCYLEELKPYCSKP